MTCDNKSNSHNPVIVSEDNNAMRVYCTECHNQFVIRKEPFKEVPENRQYSKIFKRDVLQGNDNLFYKYHPEYIRI
jgi:hypothetical protein